MTRSQKFNASSIPGLRQGLCNRCGYPHNYIYGIGTLKKGKRKERCLKQACTQCKA